MMASAQVVETSVANNCPSQDSSRQMIIFNQGLHVVVRNNSEKWTPHCCTFSLLVHVSVILDLNTRNRRSQVSGLSGKRLAPYGLQGSVILQHFTARSSFRSYFLPLRAFQMSIVTIQWNGSFYRPSHCTIWAHALIPRFGASAWCRCVKVTKLVSRCALG